jgi:hypothetical protein
VITATGLSLTLRLVHDGPIILEALIPTGWLPHLGLLFPWSISNQYHSCTSQSRVDFPRHLTSPVEGHQIGFEPIYPNLGTGLCTQKLWSPCHHMNGLFHEWNGIMVDCSVSTNLSQDYSITFRPMLIKHHWSMFHQLWNGLTKQKWLSQISPGL